MFTFGYEDGIEFVQKKYIKRRMVDTPVLYSTGVDIEVSVVVGKHLSTSQINALARFITRQGINKFQILCPLRFVAEDKDFKSGVTELFLKNSFNLEDYILPGTKIISMGRALYYLSRSSDLEIEMFYDTLLNHTYFYDPIRKCRVYVIDSFARVIGIDAFEHWNASRVMKQCAKDTYSLPDFKRNHVIIRSSEEYVQMFKDNSSNTKVAIDTETSGFDFLPTLSKKLSDRILTLELSFDGITGYHIPWKIVETNLRLTNREIRTREQIYANGKFDAKFLYFNGFSRATLHIDHDIMQSRHVVNETSRLGLKPQAFLKTSFGGYDFPLDEYKRKNKVRSYADIPSELLESYGPDDAIATFIVHHENMKDIRELDRLYPNEVLPEWSLERLYREIRIPMVNKYLDIELEGLYVDIYQLDETSNMLKHRIYEQTQEVYLALRIPKNKINLAALSYEETEEDPVEDTFKMGAFFEDENDAINIGSGQQLGQYIEEELGWRIYERDKKGFASVNKDTVARWIKDGHKEAQTIDTLAKTQTLYRSFVGERLGAKQQPSGFYKYLKVHSDGTYRVHANFSSMLAGSWRGKCRDPNLQNQPAHGEKAEIVKRHFVTKDDSEIFYSEDFSGLQLRLLAIVTGDPVMRDIFLNRGGDLHSITAYNVFCNNTYYIEDVSQECGYSLSDSMNPQAKKLDLDIYLKLRGDIPLLGLYRRFAKSINFGFAFSMAARTFALSFIRKEWTFQEIENFIIDNNLHAELSNNLSSAGDVYTGLRDYYMKHRGLRRISGLFNANEAIEWLKRENLFSKFEDIYGFEEVEKIYDAYAITAGEQIRTSFFETYKGLKDFGENQKDFAQSHGYVRSMYGNFRRLPYLLYKGKQTNMGIWSNKQAIAINTTIQSLESINVNRWILNVTKECQEKNMVSRVFNKIHDASENFVAKNELKEYNAIKKKWSLYPYPELNGIPLETEANAADYWGTKGTTKIDFKGNEVSAWELWDLGWKVTDSSIEDHASLWSVAS